MFQDGSGGKPTYSSSIASNVTHATRRPHSVTSVHPTRGQSTHHAHLPQRHTRRHSLNTSYEALRPVSTERLAARRAITLPSCEASYLPTAPRVRAAPPSNQLRLRSVGDRRAPAKTQRHSRTHPIAGATHVRTPRTQVRLNPHQQSNFVAPPVYLQTVSRPVELSLQSSLQLSLTVLVCYRSRRDI